jgi:hypothetical protein
MVCFTVVCLSAVVVVLEVPSLTGLLCDSGNYSDGVCFVREEGSGGYCRNVCKGLPHDPWLEPADCTDTWEKTLGYGHMGLTDAHSFGLLLLLMYQPTNQPTMNHHA